MPHPVAELEDALQRSTLSLQHLERLQRVRADAGAALGRGDLGRCIASLIVLARLGGPLFQFQLPTDPGDATRWQPILERSQTALEEELRHVHAMQARLRLHLADPRPWEPAWKASVARTVRLQERHLQRWMTALSIRAESEAAMAP